MILPLCLLAVSGSTFLNSVWCLAKRPKISVNDTTPINLPDLLSLSLSTGVSPEGCTIHKRCAFVATSLAMVLAREDVGKTWKIGKESLPISKPLLSKMTLMKCRQVFCNSGYWDVLVMCLTSVTEMLPKRFPWWSITAMDEIRSECILYRAMINSSSPCMEMILDCMDVGLAWVSRTPILRSLRLFWNKVSRFWNMRALSQRYLISLLCERIPLIFVVSGFVMATLWTPEPRIIIAVERFSCSDSL